MRYAEIAFSLGISNAAVKSRLARARPLLRGARRPHIASTALRQSATQRRPDEAAFARLAPEVMARQAMEPDTRWRHRVHDAIDDRQRLWMIGGTLAATLAGALVVAAFAGLAAPTHPGSLASLMRASTALGSNANPLWLVAGVTLPRVEADTRAKAMFIQPLRPLGIPNLALTAVVTQEGQLASVQVIHDGVPDAALTRAVSRLASDVHFALARARGAPVAVNVVWLLERTTVAAAPIPDLTLPAGGN